MDALAVTFGVRCKDSVLVFGGHLMFFWKFKSPYLPPYMLANMVALIQHEHTRAEHSMPLARTASMTASTFLSRDRTLALRVVDSFHGVFLVNSVRSLAYIHENNHQSRPTECEDEALNAPNMSTEEGRK